MKRGSLSADDPDYPLYSVTQVADMLGVTPAALRRWEREGLIEEGFATAAIGRLLELQDRIDDLEDQLAATHRPGHPQPRPEPPDPSTPDDPQPGPPRQ